MKNETVDKYVEKEDRGIFAAAVFGGVGLVILGVGTTLASLGARREESARVDAIKVDNTAHHTYWRIGQAFGQLRQRVNGLTDDAFWKYGKSWQKYEEALSTMILTTWNIMRETPHPKKVEM